LVPERNSKVASPSSRLLMYRQEVRPTHSSDEAAVMAVERRGWQS
jgi:hypothetical protein